MNILSLVLLAFIGLLLIGTFKPKGVAMALLMGYLFVSLSIIETGYILSFYHQFSNLNAWCYVYIIIIILILSSIYIFSLEISLPRFTELRTINRITISEKILLVILVFAVFFILVLNLIDVLFAAPQNTDALTYHLARVAYYLQHGSMEWFSSNQWPQIIHPKNSSSLFAFIFLVSDYQENFTQLPQFLSYIILIVSVYGICNELNMSKFASIISALISSLPICLVLGSTTNQNDLIISSFAGCSVYFMLCFKNDNQWKYLLLFVISAALMTGFKASSIMIIPLLALVTLFAFYENLLHFRFNYLLVLILCVFVAFIFLVLPSGYWENIILYGHPVGPESMRKEHNFEGLTLGQFVYEGSKNVVRYLANFCCLDGFLDGPKFIYDANSIIWKSITLVLENIWPDIYTFEHMRLPFGTLKKIAADEEKVFFGPIGFLLMLPLIGWGFAYGIKNLKKSPDALVCLFLATASTIFILSQSFFGQFDPWRGRMFGTMVVFAAPLCGIWWVKNSHSFLPKIYFTIVIILSCWAGIWSILFRYESSWIRPNYTHKTLFQMNRMEQLMRDLPEQYEPYKKFDQLVPRNARVISWLMGSYPEYVLFGEKLTRKIYTREESLTKYVKADYIIFDQQQFKPTPNDLPLGEGIYLRKMDL